MKNNSKKTSNLAVFSILSHIKEYGMLSQARISELTGYSRSTVSVNCEKLLNQNIIIYHNSNIQHKKKNLGLKLNKDFGVIIGVGMGGTVCRIGIYNIACELIHIETIPIDLPRGPESIVASIYRIIDDMLKKTDKKLLGIGIGIPSPVKYEEGVAYHPAFMPGWHLFEIKRLFNQRYNCPVFVDNEVNTIALEEYYSISQNRPKTLLCIKIGTGIGAGLIVSGNIYRGENGSGGNLGHIQIDGLQKKCACGNMGCIETIASVPAIIHDAEEKCHYWPESSLEKEYKKQKELSLEIIKKCADNGDRLALKIIEEAGNNIGMLLGKITTFLDPGVIIITGRAIGLGLNYLYYIRNGIHQQSSLWTGPDFEVKFSKLANDSTATGAARLCIGELFSRQLIVSPDSL